MKPIVISMLTIFGVLGIASVEVAEAKQCKRLCRPVVRRICADKYPGNARFQRLCRKEGNVEIIPYCKAEPVKNKCV